MSTKDGRSRARSRSATVSWLPGIDLGRATLRGVRKCPQCGTVNGTRGTSCKNKECRLTFGRHHSHSVDKPSTAAAGGTAGEAAAEAHTSSRIIKTLNNVTNSSHASPEAVRIITGAVNEQMYSVRVRDRGPDYRGFVQLPNLQSNDPVATTDDDHVAESAPSVELAIARCFVDTCCVRLVPSSAGTGCEDDDDDNGEDEVQPDTCQHVKASICCEDVEAVPLVLKNTVLNGLQVASEVKQAIWLLATESSGPVVQRVSKTVMVVKCQIDPKHALGFLHFYIYECSSDGQREYKFVCTCREFKTSKSTITANENHRRCVHFYACICAFASDENLSKEFSHYVNTDTTDITELHFTSVLGDAMQQLIVEAECEPDDKAWQVVVVSPDIASSSTAIKLTPAGEVYPLQSNDINNSNKRRTRAKRAIMPPPAQPPSVTMFVNPMSDQEESKACVMFIEWLASVTERVNQTMHYGSCGRPEPLVFQAPQHFFDCLQQRIAAGVTTVGGGNARKRRLPNVMTTFERTSPPPLGVFSKYTWHINSVAQVKRILDTPQIPLEVIRTFVQNRDGTYDVVVQPSKLIPSNQPQQPAIKPCELKTYLKVGYTNSEDKLPTSFIIEWIPDILPKSKIGEMSLRFEYGHQRNGQVIEHRND